MDLDSIKKDILTNRYTESFEAAKSAYREDEPDRAAKYFHKAARELEKLDDVTVTDYAAQVERLDTVARSLERGEAVDVQSVSKYATDREATSGTDREAADRRSADSDEPDLDATIESFIVETDVTWDDIGGLESVKGELKRTIALGAIREKPAGVETADRILLFGPPGNGKTLLASAIAGSLDATFFDIKLGGLLSKYFGESSKQISALFDLAAEYSPSVIFLDELDAITQSRDADLDESSRRVLTTLLSELSGTQKSTDDFVLVLGATNTPWDLDAAIRRRFTNRILIPGPDAEAAAEIISIHTTEKGIGFDGEPDEFADRVESASSPIDAIAADCVRRGFTGSDIAALCRDAITHMVDRENPGLEGRIEEGIEAVQGYELSVGPIEPADIDRAFDRISPSLSEQEIGRYDAWAEQFGT